MKALYIPVEGDPRAVDIENTLKAFQEMVGGRIETVTRGELVYVVNEEGQLNGLTLNITASMLCGIPLCGGVLVCGSSGDEFADVPERLLRIWRGKEEHHEVGDHDRA